MEELIKEQVGDILALKRKIDEFSKDNHGENYSKEICEEQIKFLDDWYKVFDERNAKLEPFVSNVTAEQPYFREASYSKSKALWERYREKIVKQRDRMMSGSVGEPSNAMLKVKPMKHDLSFLNDNLFDSEEDSEEDSEPEVVKVLKFQLHETIATLSSAEKINDESSIGLARAQLENLKTIWSDFRTAYRNISTSANKAVCKTMKFDVILQCVAS